jgi:hypothetical protein
MTTYDDLVVAERITISIDKQLAESLRRAAGEDDANVSAWVSDAIERSLNSRGLRAVVAQWEAEYGAFTPEELDRARQRLGW